ncbi:Auxin-induced protein [Musa troglodytarum]|uniref:Auxin-induced protein n=1 Tax=Musa troglodytarum TaxID=320322 RepID=A0A9E7KFV1_9LILI|nr:Auxin-induced protein [Musa troglodytarum]
MGGCDEFMWRTILYIMMIILQFSFIGKPVMNQIFYWPEVYICYLLIHHEQHLAGHDLRGWRAYRVVGTLVIVVGAMLMAIYKGPPMELVWSKHTDSLGSNSPVVTESSSNNWFMGFCFHILSTLASASLSLLWV